MRSPSATRHQGWKEGRDHVAGHLLRDWSAVPARVLRELEGLGFETIEDLANVSDAHVTRIIDGRAWREKAVRFLKSPVEPLQENVKLKTRIEELQEEVSTLKNKLKLRNEKRSKYPELKTANEKMKAAWEERRAREAHDASHGIE